MDLQLIENESPHRIEEHPGHGDLVEFPSEDLLCPFANRLTKPIGGGNDQKRRNSDHKKNNRRGKERGGGIAKEMFQPSGTAPDPPIPLAGNRRSGQDRTHQSTFRIEAPLVKQRKHFPMVTSGNRDPYRES